MALCCSENVLPSSSTASPLDFTSWLHRQSVTQVQTSTFPLTQEKPLRPHVCLLVGYSLKPPTGQLFPLWNLFSPSASSRLHFSCSPATHWQPTLWVSVSLISLCLIAGIPVSAQLAFCEHPRSWGRLQLSTRLLSWLQVERPAI